MPGSVAGRFDPHCDEFLDIAHSQSRVLGPIDETPKAMPVAPPSFRTLGKAAPEPPPELPLAAPAQPADSVWPTGPPPASPARIQAAGPAQGDVSPMPPRVHFQPPGITPAPLLRTPPRRPSGSSQLLQVSVVVDTPSPGAPVAQPYSPGRVLVNASQTHFLGNYDADRDAASSSPASSADSRTPSSSAPGPRSRTPPRRQRRGPPRHHQPKFELFSSLVFRLLNIIS